MSKPRQPETPNPQFRDSGAQRDQNQTTSRDTVMTNSGMSGNYPPNEEMEQYRARAQAFLDRYLRTGFLHGFAKDSSLTFKLSHGFFFNPETCEVNLDTSWFFERNFTEEQILWAVMHEVFHFRDLAEDSEGFLYNHEHFKKMGVKMANIVLPILTKKLDPNNPADKEYLEGITKQEQIDDDEPEKGTINKIGATYAKIFSTFYNVLDDIWVNTSVEHNAPIYERTRGKHGQQIIRLYREVLFRGNDYRKHPRYEQFMFTLLRTEMVPDEAIIVSSDVQEALNKIINVAGTGYTPQEFIKKFIKPLRGQDTKAGTRSHLIRTYIEPIFEELLLKDLDDWEKLPPPPKGSDGKGGQPGVPRKDGGDEGEDKDGKGGQPGVPRKEGGDEGEDKDGKGGQPGVPRKEGGDEGGDEGEKGGQPKGPDTDDGKEGGDEGGTSSSKKPSRIPFEDRASTYQDSTIDQIPDKARQKAVKKYKQTQEEKKRKAAQTPEQRIKESVERQEQRWLDKTADNMSVRERLERGLEQFKKLRKEVEPYLDELSELWQFLIHGKSQEIQKGVDGPFKTGTELDIQKVIQQFGDIQKGDVENVRIFNRETTKEVASERPELIRVRIVGDTSGSMGGQKLEMLKKISVLLLSSLNNFNDQLDITRKETKTKLRVETEVYQFSDTAGRIKTFSDKDRKEEILMLDHLSELGGGTQDDLALNMIVDSISPEDERNIQSGKVLDIVIEVTDGHSGNQEGTKQSIEKLQAKGVIIRALHVSENESEGEDEIFNAIWNENQQMPLGEHVGNLDGLAKAVVKILKGYLSDVKL